MTGRLALLAGETTIVPTTPEIRKDMMDKRRKRGEGQVDYLNA